MAIRFLTTNELEKEREKRIRILGASEPVTETVLCACLRRTCIYPDCLVMGMRQPPPCMQLIEEMGTGND